MKNIVGQTPRGDDFYPRTQIINTLYRRLEAGNHVFISAPRRAGKTSIMRFLEDKPREGYAFVYISVEDVNDVEEYFQVLSEETLESKAVGKLVKASDTAKGIFDAFAERIKKIKVFNVEIETQQKERATYSDEFEQLMRQLDTKQFTIVLLIDEFPVALEKIAKKYSPETAIQFLHDNRTIRQRAKKGIQFVYTGSIGLPNIARQLRATATINDLNIVDVTPFSQAEASDFTQKLFGSYSIQYEVDVIPYMLQRLEWLMPFFIQLIVQLLIDEFEVDKQKITTKTVDAVINKASNHRNNIYFANYYSRLEKSLPKAESELATVILNEIAEKGSVPLNHFNSFDLSNRVLDILEYDGYINSLQNAYQFNSPILRHWWRKYAH